MQQVHSCVCRRGHNTEVSTFVEFTTKLLNRNTNSNNIYVVWMGNDNKINCYIERGSLALAGFYAGLLFRSNWNLEMSVFEEEVEEKPSEKGDNQQ